MFTEMVCSECSKGTGAWFEPSGAPHYHFYYCEECKEQMTANDQDDGDQ